MEENCVACPLDTYLFESRCIGGCPIGYFANQNNGECDRCDSKCISCQGPTDEDCDQCIDLYGFEGRKCVFCDQRDGFYLEDNKCFEVCGDGKNRGDLPCDDGNRADGDGCSKDCQIEEGWKCTGGDNTGMDKCVDVKPPTATLRVSQENVLFISFSEQLFAENISPSDLKIITFKNGNENMPIVLKAKTVQLIDGQTLRVTLNLSNYTPRGGEKLVVEFLSFEKFTDLAHNTVEGDTLQDKLNKPKEEKPFSPTVEQIGQNAKTTTAAGSGLAWILAVLSGYCLSSVWTLVGAIQILYYIPLLNVDLPPNYRQVLKYLDFVELFDLFPFDFDDKPTWTKHFENFGIDHTLFLENGWTFLLIVTFFLFLILVVVLIDVCTMVLKKQRLRFICWLEKKSYPGVFRAMLESYLPMVLFSSLQVLTYKLSDTANIVSLVLGSVTLLAFLVFPLLLMLFLQNNRSRLEESQIQLKYGSLYDEFDTRHAFKINFYTLFLIRRLVYIATLLFLFSYPDIQQSLCFSFSFLTLLYLCRYRPYRTKSENFIAIFVEFCITATFGLISYLVADKAANTRTSNTIGLVLISLLVAIVVVCLVHVYGGMVVSLVKKLKKSKKGRKVGMKTLPNKKSKRTKKSKVSKVGLATPSIIHLKGVLEEEQLEEFKTDGIVPLRSDSMKSKSKYHDAAETVFDTTTDIQAEGPELETALTEESLLPNIQKTAIKHVLFKKIEPGDSKKPRPRSSNAVLEDLTSMTLSSKTMTEEGINKHKNEPIIERAVSHHGLGLHNSRMLVQQTQPELLKDRHAKGSNAEKPIKPVSKAMPKSTRKRVKTSMKKLR